MFIILVWIWGSENKVVYIKLLMDELNFKIKKKMMMNLKNCFWMIMLLIIICSIYWIYINLYFLGYVVLIKI